MVPGAPKQLVAENPSDEPQGQTADDADGAEEKCQGVAWQPKILGVGLVREPEVAIAADRNGFAGSCGFGVRHGNVSGSDTCAVPAAKLQRSKARLRVAVIVIGVLLTDRQDSGGFGTPSLGLVVVRRFGWRPGDHEGEEGEEHDGPNDDGRQAETKPGVGRDVPVLC